MKKIRCLLIPVLIGMMAACQREMVVTPSESAKTLNGSWKVIKAIRNGTDLTSRFNFSSFRIDFKDSLYTLDSLVPFPVSTGGSFHLDDPKYPFKIYLKEAGSDVKALNMEFPIADGVRNIIINFSQAAQAILINTRFKKSISKLFIMSSTIQYIKRSKWWKVTLMLMLAFLVIIGCSITIDSIDQPDSINGGETLTSTLHVTISTNAARDNTKFMVALLVPKVWNTAKNADLSFTSSVTTGTQRMVAVPIGAGAPQAGGRDWPTLITDVVGNGGNLLPGWEWVAFYSDKAYSVKEGATITVTITVKVKASQDNVSFKLGYVVANNSDGLSDPQYYASSFPGCFRVFGTGDLMDFCNPQVGSVDPLNSLENDIVTLGFDAGVIDNDLSDASDVYICLKGVTTGGDTLNFCGQDAATKLSSYGVKKWRIDLWPRSFFKLTPDQHLVSMVYYFTDKSGQKKVGKDGTAAAPFVYTFKCL